MKVIYATDKIEDFINSQNKETNARIKNLINLLQTEENLLDMPDSKSLGNGMFELRLQGKIKIRILYIF